MLKIVLNRESGLKTAARYRVAPGTVFRASLRGKPGKYRYVALASNGRLFSLNLDTGHLASTDHEDKTVFLDGKCQLKTIRWPSWKQTDTSRSKVQSGDMFQVKGGVKTYVALGTISRDGKGTRYASLDMADPLGSDYSTTEKGSSSVTVIGHVEFHATTVAA